MKKSTFFNRAKIIFRANREFTKYVFKHHWLLFLVQTIAICMSGFSGAFASKISKVFIDSIFVTHDLWISIQPIAWWMVYMLAMNVVQHFATTYTNYVFSTANITVKANISSKISNLKMSYFDDPDNKNTLSRAIKYAEAGGPQLLNYFFSLLTNIVGIISIFFVLSPFAWWIALFLVFLTVYKAVVEVIVSKANYTFQKEKTLLNRKTAYFGGILFNQNQLLDLNIFNAFRFFFSKYKEVQEENILLNRKHSVKINMLNLVALFAVVLQNLVLYGYVGMSLLNGTMSLAEFTMFFTATNYFNTILSNFRKSFSQFVPMSLEAQNYDDFLNTADEYKYRLEGDEAAKIKVDSIQTIEFRNVSFCYPLKNSPVIKNVSFCIQAGEIVSLVGMNGAGKTTLIKLILGLYNPTEGQILINGHPIESVDTSSYWQRCATMFQNINIYSLTAYENITFDRSMSCDLTPILEATDLTETFKRHENGLATPLSRDFDPKGVLLSGGERQKVAFARLCYHERDLWILDEPSSALDARAENDMFKFVDKVHKDDAHKIVLFVSHRLSSSVCADKIIFIKNGELVNIGNHDHLMLHCNDYRDLFMMQAEKYVSKEKK